MATSQRTYTQSFPIQNEQCDLSRIAAMKRYWHAFDDIHARQASGMKPLWGMVEDSRMFNIDNRFHFREPYQFHLYQQLLPPPLLAEINQLWGTTMHIRWPERVLSEPFPHMLLAETFGPALKFWHGCALTAWFYCEGPSFRTDLAGLEAYLRKEVQALKEMGTPINEQLFDKLIKAEAQLGKPQSFLKNPEESGTATTFTKSYRTRRDGFGVLRDIISSYRRQWAEQYLDQYLDQRRELELSGARHAYDLYIGTQVTLPEAKKFVKAVVKATNHWFGGNINELCTAIQKEAPFQSQYCAILPANKLLFASMVFTKLSELKSSSMKEINKRNSSDTPVAKNNAEREFYQLNKLVVLSFWYVQLEEALGYRPTLQNFGIGKFSQERTVLHTDINKAWSLFARAIEDAKKATSIKISTSQHTESHSSKQMPSITPVPSTTPSPAKASPVLRRAPETIQQASESISAKSPVVPPPAIKLDSAAVSKLQEESEKLLMRLLIEEETEQQPLHPMGISDPVVVSPDVTDSESVPLNEATSELVSLDATASIAEIDEDWKNILQQWQPEHWEMILLLYQEQYAQLITVERKAHRPVSRLIDEINLPVDEQLGDLLVDPDTRLISQHLHATVSILVNWYLSSQSR
ncbi:hypothetical protein KDH_11910 [Dictyobacter sp. S3.2.2.5]|uniref:TerB-C domain-containing protein n=1 Tax=Dictyobacter halimunensis TaxID=3026934 RepID=A0ABQ6FMU8_9CHLR|nr:hypothetical protein KDH_11910 [Dictyobacter sp. S3.2.2.5]